MPDSKYSVPPGWKRGQALEIIKREGRIDVDIMRDIDDPIDPYACFLSFRDYSNFIGFIEWWFK